MFYDLAVRNPIDRNSRRSNLFAARRNAEQLARLCTVAAKARHNLIPFADHIFADVASIGRSDEEVCEGCFYAFQVGRKARRGIMVDEVWSDKRIKE